MNRATIVCTNGHPTVHTSQKTCKLCGSEFVPIELVTKSSRMPVSIMGWNIDYDDLAVVRYKIDGSMAYNFQEDELDALNTNAGQLLRTLFEKGIITGK